MFLPKAPLLYVPYTTTAVLNCQTIFFVVSCGNAEYMFCFPVYCTFCALSACIFLPNKIHFLTLCLTDIAHKLLFCYVLPKILLTKMQLLHLDISCPDKTKPAAQPY